MAYAVAGPIPQQSAPMSPAPCSPTALFLGGLLVLSQPLAAQPPCVTEADETDPFTKVRVLSVAGGGSQLVGPGHGTAPSCRWRSVDGAMSVEFTWTVDTDEPIAVLERDPLLLILENDSLLQLFSLGTVVAIPSLRPLGTGRATGAFEYPVTPAQAKLLAKYWVGRMRLYHSNGFQDFVAENDPSWQQGLESVTTCFLQACANAPLPVNTVVSQKAEPLPVPH